MADGPKRLPPFPVDAATLDMLWLAIHPGPGAESTSVSDLLRLYEELGGSDPTAVAEVIDEHIVVMRDAGYHTNDVISALIIEVLRLRAEQETADGLLARCVDVLRQAQASLPSPTQCWCVHHGRADGPNTQPGRCDTCDLGHRDLQARANVAALLNEIGERDG